MRVDVRQEHIDNGRRGDGRRCPVTLAVSEELDMSEGEIHVTMWAIVHLGQGHYWPLPLLVQEWIKAFDNGLPVEPISFDLNLEVLK